MSIRLGIGDQLSFRRRGGSQNASKFLFFGERSKITGGKLYNQKAGSTDWLTVAGAAGSETYQTPNTAAYIAADTDYIWFKTDTTLRTTTTAELVGYDFPQTIVKYLNVAPYTIEWIAIRNPTPVGDLTTTQENQMRDQFDLSIWWNGVLSAHGNLKGNRGPSQSVWTPEIVNPILDGNTLAWYDFTDASTITKDGSNYVSLWKDKLLSGHDLAQADANKKPLLTANGILFDGLANPLGDSMKTGAFVFIQPSFVYAVLRQVTWTDLDRIWDGFTLYSTVCTQNPATPTFGIYAGGAGAITGDLTVNAFGIIRALYNGANSTLQVNAVAPTTGSIGTNTFGGFTLGGHASGTAQCSNIEVKEVILRKTADDAATQTYIYNYLKAKYSL